MIRKCIAEAKPNVSFRRPTPGQVFLNRHRGDDATERLHRLTEALRRYGYDIPRSNLAGPEDITWID
jgi:N-acetyl-anhydromuramyl-L-alanine amidase AmpD